MNKAMLGHRFKYQALYVPTISRKFKAIGRKSFGSQLFEMRFLRILQIEFLKKLSKIFTFTLIFEFSCVV